MLRIVSKDIKIRSVSPAITTIRLARRARAKCALDSGGIGRRNVHYGAEWRVSTTWAIYVWFKSKPIQEVEFKPVALRSAGRDSRLREKGYYWVCSGRL